MIIDDTLDMLERIKAAVREQLPKTKPSTPEMGAAFWTRPTQELRALKERVRDARDAFLATLPPDSTQRKLWDDYRSIAKANGQTVFITDPTYEPEEEKARRAKFIASLDQHQKHAYKKARKAKWTYNEKQEEVKDALLNPGKAVVADVPFPDHLPQNRRSVIIQLLNNIFSYGQGKETRSEILFQCIYDGHNHVTGLKVFASGGAEKTISKYLEGLAPLLQRLKSDLPALAQRWEKIRTQRGNGYRYVMDRELDLDDPVFTMASSLSALNPDLKEDRALFEEVNGKYLHPFEYEELEKQCRKQNKPLPPSTLAIVLTGQAAELILKDEFGYRLTDIPEAKKERGK